MLRSLPFHSSRVNTSQLHSKVPNDLRADKPSVVINIRDTGLDGYPSDWSLICIAIGYKLLQLQCTSTNETESWAHGAGAIHVAFPQRPERVGVIEGDATLLKVKGQTEPRWQGIGEACRCGWAVVSGTISMVTVVMIAVLGQVDLTHPHS